MSDRVDRDAVFRILDANANRALEGLRTVEELARFLLQNPSMSAELKSLRHDLQLVISRLPEDRLLDQRNAAGDIGQFTKTENECHRRDVVQLGAAAAQRVQQSVRCLEEFAKLLRADLAAQFEAIRYRAYDVLARLQLLLGREALRAWLHRAQLYLLIDCQRPLAEFARLLEELSFAGVDLVQIRDKRRTDRELIAYIQAAKESCSDRTRVIVNDRIDLAIVSDADGVHLGQDDLPIAQARSFLPQSKWIGVSTHDATDLENAIAGGADYVGCGPTFATPTKEFDQFAGPDFLRQVSKFATIPFFAIGGITLQNLAQVLASGCNRVAVSSGILQTPNPAETASMMKSMLIEPQHVSTSATSLVGERSN